jgi:hypothetical protein
MQFSIDAFRHYTHDRETIGETISAFLPMTKRTRRTLRSRTTARRRSSPNSTGTRGSEPKKTIVVIGDVTLDWLQEEIPRWQSGSERRHNYELYPGFRWTSIWGGAALVERLLCNAIKKRGLGSSFEFDGVHKRLTAEMKKNPHDFLQSLAVVKEMVKDEDKHKDKDKEIPVRVDFFKGFMEATKEPTASPKKGKKLELYPTGALSPHCVVVDDAANGCRDDDDFVSNLKRLTAKAQHIFVKLSRPLDQSRIMDAVARRAAKPGRHTVVIVNADDLRAQGLDISRRLSWEHSAIDLITAAHSSSIMSNLGKIGDVLVRFGNDGCIVMERVRRGRRGRRYLVFDPRRAEGTYDQDLSGTMPGATSAFTADLTTALLSNMPLRDAVPQALCTSRRVLKKGFIDPASTASGTGATVAATTKTVNKMFDYPLDVFETDDRDQAEFVTRNLPVKTAGLNEWSILSARIKESPSDLANKIVLDGHEEHLKEVPVASFGNLLLIDRHEIEGYRSIENLLREYIKSRHGKKPRPLSVGVFGPPGSGKSFGIKEIAGCIKEAEIKILPFNLTQFDKPTDLIGAFHTARDEALKGRLPLLIFDEFDCPFEGNHWGWLKYFLAPMQDGEFSDNGRIHPIGNAIFVFAGGIAHSFDDFTKSEKANSPADAKSNSKPPAKSNSKSSTKTSAGAPPLSGSKSAEEPDSDFKKAKGPDFASRLKGYVNVAGINPPIKDGANEFEVENTEPDSVCMVRRAILLRALLFDQEHRTRNMNPITMGKNRLDIDGAVLNALLGTSQYRYGARSLESILIMSRLTDRDHFGVASLPSDEQLRIHVDGSFVKILKGGTRPFKKR